MAYRSNKDQRDTPTEKIRIIDTPSIPVSVRYLDRRIHKETPGHDALGADSAGLTFRVDDPAAPGRHAAPHPANDYGGLLCERPRVGGQVSCDCASNDGRRNGNAGRQHSD